MDLKKTFSILSYILVTIILFCISFSKNTIFKHSQIVSAESPTAVERDQTNNDSENALNKIFIKEATLIDSKNSVIRNIYENVKERDDVWESIKDGQKIKVTFEKPLDNAKDITLFARASLSNTPVRIDVYAENSDELLGTFNNINKLDTYKILLSKLNTQNNTFELRVIGNVDIDFIVDPPSWTKHEIAGPLYWLKIVSSSDGTKLVAVNFTGYIYTSTDSGNTWTERPSAGARVWRDITMTADGTKIALNSHYGHVVTSTDSGATWTEQMGSPANSWGTIKCSADGSILLATGTDGSVAQSYIYKSTDFGVTWKVITDAGRKNWNTLAISNNGGRAVASVSNGFIYTSNDFGETWVQQNGSGSRNWTNIIISSDGSKLAVTVSNSIIYTSSDYGVTWDPQNNSGSRNWSGLAASTDGSKLVAPVNNGYIYTSDNFGVDWTEQTASGVKSWGKVAASSDRTKIFLITTYGEYIYSSLDSGISWTEKYIDHSDAYWHGVCSSSDGTKLVAVTYYDGYIYTSSNSGNTWTKQENSGSKNWYNVTCSSDGSKIAASVSPGYIYTSDDYGVTWVEHTSSGSRSWYSIASSSDGSKLVAGVSNGYIYTSNNYGSTWTEQTNPGSRAWVSVDSSSDGSKLVAATYSGYIYTSNNYGSTWTQQNNAGSKSWRSVTMSSDATKLAAVAYNGYIYTSADSGITWVEQKASGVKYWFNIAASSDGSKLVASSISNVNHEDTSIYSSKDFGAHWIKQIGIDSGNSVYLSSSSDGGKILAGVANNYLYIGIIDNNSYPPEIHLDEIDNPNHDPTPSISGALNDNTGFPVLIEYQLDGTSDTWTSCDFNNVNLSDSQSFEDSFPPSGYTLSGDVNWTQDGTTAQAGSKSATTGTITHDQTSTISKTINIEHDAVLSFYWKISSELMSDFLLFCVDNENCSRAGGFEDRISGTIDWEQKSVKLTEGPHILTWKYTKDPNSSSGSDKGWIDNISFRSADEFTCNITNPLANGEHKIYLRSEDSIGDMTAVENYTMKDFTVDYDVLVEESNNTTKISEDGLTDNFFVSLAIDPSDDVTITLSTSDDLVTILPNSLTFTPLNWSTPQEVVLSIANNNLINEQTRHGNVYFSVTSDDPNYANSEVQKLRFKITDHNYGDRITESNKDDIDIIIKNINGFNRDDFEKISSNNDIKKVVVHSNKLEFTFDNVVSEAEIDKYTIRLQKTDSLGRPIGSYTTWIDNIDDKDKEYNKKLDKEGYSITYKDGKIRFKADGDKYRLKDGTYYLKVRAYDKVGNFVQSDAVKLVVDDSPEVKLSLNKIGSIPFEPEKYKLYYYTSNKVTFQGSATKDSSVALIVNGVDIVSIKAGDKNDYLLNANLNNGINNIQLKSQDEIISFTLNIDPQRTGFPQL